MSCFHSDPTFILGDCLEVMRAMPEDSVDLVFGSPPYEDARSYGIGFDLSGDDWVEWALERFVECLRICRGLVGWVVEGRTREYAYSATPLKLALRIQEAGYMLRKPPIFHRQGIPGTGGPDWLRNDYEFIVCACKCGPLPWSDPTALGSVPRYKSPRTATNRGADGVRKSVTYYDPEISNPGNVISLTVGRGHLGWNGAHENEAPFPTALAEFFVRSFCPPGGIALDPFSGSGTTVAVAHACGRRGIGIDIRQSQIDLGGLRLDGLEPDEAKRGQIPLFGVP